MKHLILLLLALPFLCHAETPLDTELLGRVDRVGIHTVSRHVPSNGANDINLGVFVTTTKRFVIGTYYNSRHVEAYYAGFYTPEWYRFTLTLGGVTGYYAPVSIILLPTLRVYSFAEGPSVYISGSPFRLTEDGQSVLHLSLVWALP